MAFCINCGHKLIDNAKFCANCGTPVAYSEGNVNTRKSVFEGELHKCPCCGEVLNSFISDCPTCGYEIRGSSSSRSIKEFIDKIERATTESQVVTLIRNFPVPNTKEDMMEFVILAATNADSEDISSECVTAWLVKLEQCQHKCSFMLKDDPDYDEIQSIYNEAVARVSKRQKKQKRARLKKQIVINVNKSQSSTQYKKLHTPSTIIGFIGGLVALLFSAGLDPEGAAGLQLLGGIILIITSFFLFGKKAGYLDILCGAASGILSFVIANHLLPEGTAFCQLIDALVLLIVVISYFKALARK